MGSTCGREQECPRYRLRDLVPIQISNGEVTTASARVSGRLSGALGPPHETCQGSPFGSGSLRTTCGFCHCKGGKSRAGMFYCVENETIEGATRLPAKS